MGAYSLGSILAQGIVGSVAGGGKAAGEDLEEQSKAAIEALRDQRLALLAQTTHAANVQTDLEALPQKLAIETSGKVAEQGALAPGVTAAEQAKSDIATRAKNAERIIAPAGSTVITPGIPDTTIRSDEGDGTPTTIAGTPDRTYTAPIKTPDEQRKYYEAHANYENAMADAVRSGSKEKVQLPNVKVETDENGQKTLIDQNSGAIGTIVPGTDATPEVKHWFSPNEPAKAKGMPGVQWSYNGQPLKGGLTDLYPSIQARTAKAGKAPTGIVDNGAIHSDEGGDNAQKSEPKPPAAYPSAKLAPDGKWYVKNPDGSYSRVVTQ